MSMATIAASITHISWMAVIATERPMTINRPPSTSIIDVAQVITCGNRTSSLVTNFSRPVGAPLLSLAQPCARPLLVIPVIEKQSLIRPRKRYCAIPSPFLHNGCKVVIFACLRPEWKFPGRAKVKSWSAFPNLQLSQYLCAEYDRDYFRQPDLVFAAFPTR